MKLFKYIFVVVVLGVVVYAIVRYRKEVAVAVPVDSQTRYLCYSWNTKAGDKALLRMGITGGTQITGSFDFLPAEKDKKTGPIEGTAGPVDQKAMARTADLWWTASAEGMTTKEQLKIVFGEGSAQAGFGEMKNRGDGVYVYAHPDALSYTPTLSQTDCGNQPLNN